MQRETFLDKLPKEIKDELLSLRNQKGRTVSECVVWLAGKMSIAVPRTTLSDWFLRQRRQEILGVTITAAAPQRQAPSESPQRPENLQEKVSTDKIIESHKARASYFERAYKESIKNASGLDDLVRVAKEVTNAIPAVQVKIPQFSKPKAEHKQYIVAPLSDTHIGEIVDREQMGGLNEFNMDIFNRRLYGWSEQVVSLTNLRRSYVEIPDLYVPCLGDMVSGDIHLELTRTNQDHIMGQMIRGANLIAQALVKVSSQFENVYVPCVVGNHGRMTQKPTAKNHYVDFDYMLFQWCAAFCRNQKNIHFTIPKSFLHTFDVAGHNILIMHGDSVKSWQGIPYYGLLRSVAQLRQSLQMRRELEKRLQNFGGTVNTLLLTLSEYFDSMIVGHFHSQNELDIGTGVLLQSGCFKGGDEYSFGKLHTLSRPTQLFSVWHPVYGYISRDNIFLEKYSYAEEKFEDSISDVWIESRN